MGFTDIQLPSNRKFGFFFTAVFVLAGAYFINTASIGLANIFFGIAGVFLVVTLLKAEVLLTLNKLWMRFGLLLGIIVSPIVLGAIFFLMVTPISLLTGAFGRDELRLKLADRKTYWKNRSNNSVGTDTFKNQF